MKAKDFLEFMDDKEDFPEEYGRWISFEVFFPPFTARELRQMVKQGIIQADFIGKQFRLTSKATAIRDGRSIR